MKNGMNRFGPIAIVLLLPLGGITPLHAQIVPDFVLADSALVEPDLQLDRHGNLYLAWAGHDPGVPKFTGTRLGFFDSLGQPLQAPLRLTSGSLYTHPRLALSATHAVIVQQSSENYDINPVFGHLVGLDEIHRQQEISYDGDGLPPDVTYLNDSTFIAVWGAEPSGPNAIYGQIATNSLRVVRDRFLIAGPAAEDFEPTAPRVLSSSASEDYVIIWADGIPGDLRLYGRWFDPTGVARDSSFLITADPQPTLPWFFSVAMHTGGEIAVVWGAERDSSRWVVQLRRFHADATPMGPAIQVSDSSDVGAYAGVDVAFDLDGDFVVVWEDYAPNSTRIFAQRYLADGMSLGGNFQVSRLPGGFPHYWPSVQLRGDTLYTAWNSNGAIWANILDFNDPALSLSSPAAGPPRSFILHHNYPNPFNPSTTLRYDLPHASHVSLVIYDLAGREVRRWDRLEPPGFQQLVWDGRDASCQSASSGIYIYRLAAVSVNSAERFTATRKMVLLK